MGKVNRLKSDSVIPYTQKVSYGLCFFYHGKRYILIPNLKETSIDLYHTNSDMFLLKNKLYFTQITKIDDFVVYHHYEDIQCHINVHLFMNKATKKDITKCLSFYNYGINVVTNQGKNGTTTGF